MSGATVEIGAAAPDADGLHGLSQRLERYGTPIRAAIESMNGARFVHDRLELAGWQVEIADAQKVKGLAPLAARPIASMPGCWPSSPAAIWCRRSGCPIYSSGLSGSGRAGGCTWCATAPASSSACTRSCSPTASPAQSPICLASAAAGCSPGSTSRSRGKERLRPACA